MAENALRVDGQVAAALDLTFLELGQLADTCGCVDISQVDSKRRGDALKLKDILRRADPSPAATYLTLHATADDFAASVPLNAVEDDGLLVFRLDGEPLPVALGGPFRFLIPDPTACHTSELDECASVKFVDRMELSAGKGRDTRPEDEAEHEELHRHES
jgi:DMSO/TMAO reductase YedYZ molybdopterin-dependent catalytic subunit